MVFPTFSHLSLNLPVRSSWSGLQPAPSLVFDGWRILKKLGPLEKALENHFSILALKSLWTVWKGQKVWHWKDKHRKLAKLITWTTAFSHSMKLRHAMWGHWRWASHGGEVWQIVVHWRREWQAISVFLPWTPWIVRKGKMVVWGGLTNSWEKKRC